MSQYASNLETGSGGSGGNLSVGTVTVTAPTSATEVGFVDGSGNLQPFSGTSTATGPNVHITNASIASTANTNGSVSNSTTISTTPTSFTPPTNAVGFQVESESTNTVNLRYSIGGAASPTTGMLLEPGRDSNYIPTATTVSVASVSGSGQSCSILWVMSS